MLFNSISGLILNRQALLSGRLKRTDTIIRKLRREKTMKLSSMDDIVGFRIIVSTRAEQKKVVDCLSNGLSVKAIKDYVDSPPASGYRGIHIIGAAETFLSGNREPTRFTYEIQVRTFFQHIWSTTSESFGEQVKEGGGSLEQREYLDSFSKKVVLFEENNPDFVQDEGLVPDGKINYFVVNFDKSKGVLIKTQMFYDAIVKALEYYQYLENLLSKNLNNEVTLLAVPHGEERLRITHLRYFRPYGRPEIPIEIRPETAIPGS
ncbi:RelA/SpoT domain-containing protein [Sulfuricella denitrificans]|nr:RelA/SpoT domain-containing protein [Sulfuricella denitrificans]